MQRLPSRPDALRIPVVAAVGRQAQRMGEAMSEQMPTDQKVWCMTDQSNQHET